MYWAVVTMTTVGYGDVVPVTGLGKLVASVVMIMGYGIIAVPTGIVSAEMNYALRYSSGRECEYCGVSMAHLGARFCHECGTPNSKKS